MSKPWPNIDMHLHWLHGAAAILSKDWDCRFPLVIIPAASMKKKWVTMWHSSGDFPKGDPSNKYVLKQFND